MKMTRIEKIIMVVTIVLTITSIITIGYAVKKIRDHGGIRQIIIELGQNALYIKKEMGKIKIEQK